MMLAFTFSQRGHKGAKGAKQTTHKGLKGLMETGRKQNKQDPAVNATTPSGTRHEPAKPVTATVKTSEKMSEKTAKSSEKTSEKILAAISHDGSLTIPALSTLIGVTERSIERNIRELQHEGRLRRIGPAKGGHWEVLK